MVAYPFFFNPFCNNLEFRNFKGYVIDGDNWTPPTHWKEYIYQKEKITSKYILLLTKSLPANFFKAYSRFYFHSFLLILGNATPYRKT